MARRSTAGGARQWLGNLLVAWTFVSGSALVLATAYYQRTRDLEILLVWLAPPFLVGSALFLVLTFVVLLGRVRDPDVEIRPARGTRESIFRK